MDSIINVISIKVNKKLHLNISIEILYYSGITPPNTPKIIKVNVQKYTQMSMFTLAKLTLIMLLSTPSCPLTSKLTVN